MLKINFKLINYYAGVIEKGGVKHECHRGGGRIS